MKKSFLSIASIFILGSLAALGQLVFPGKKTSLAEISEMADVYRTQAEAHAEAPVAAEQRASLSPDADHILHELESVEDKLLEEKLPEDESDTGGESRIRELEAQQQSFIQEIARLKKALNGAPAYQPAGVVPAVAVTPAESSKDKENLKLLANHILQLRELIKSEKESAASKAAEIESLRARIGDLEKQSEESKRTSEGSDERSEQLAMAVASLRDKISALEADKKSADDAVRAKEKVLGETNEELENTKRQLSKTIDDVKSCNLSLAAEGKVSAEIPTMKSKLEDLQISVAERDRTIAERDREIATLKTQNADKEQILGNIPGLKKELLAAKNQLLMKEKELQLAGKGASIHTGVSQESKDRMLEQSGRRAGEESIRGKSEPMTSDVMVVEVLGSRVALRSGPSPDDSEIMPVGKGTRLTVEERTGEWYRVIAPNSMRAFIRADMVRVLSQDGSSTERRAPKRQARKLIKPDADMESFGNVDAAAPTPREMRALDRLRQGMEGERPRAPELIP